MKNQSLFIRSISVVCSLIMLFTITSCMDKREIEDDPVSHNVELKSQYSGVLEGADAELALIDDKVILTLDGEFEIEEKPRYDDMIKGLKVRAHMVYTGTMQISDNTVTATFDKGTVSKLEFVEGNPKKYLEKKAEDVEGHVIKKVLTEEQASALLSALNGEGSYSYDTTVFMQMILDGENNTFEVVREERFGQYGSLEKVIHYEKNRAVLVEEYMTKTKYSTTKMEYSESGVLLSFDKNITDVKENTIITARYNNNGDEIEYYEERTKENKTTYVIRRSPGQEVEYNYNVDEEGVEYICNESIYDATGYSYTSTKSNGVLLEESRYEYDQSNNKYNIVKSKIWTSDDNDYRTRVYEYKTDGSIIRTTYYANNEIRSIYHYVELEDGLTKSYSEETYRIYADGKSRVYVKAINQIGDDHSQFEEIQRFEYHDNGVLKEMKITYCVDYSKRILTYDESGNLISDVRTDSEGNAIQ